MIFFRGSVWRPATTCVARSGDRPQRAGGQSQRDGDRRQHELWSGFRSLGTLRCRIFCGRERSSVCWRWLRGFLRLSTKTKMQRHGGLTPSRSPTELISSPTSSPIPERCCLLTWPMKKSGREISATLRSRKNNAANRSHILFAMTIRVINPDGSLMAGIKITPTKIVRDRTEGLRSF